TTASDRPGRARSDGPARGPSQCPRWSPAATAPAARLDRPAAGPARPRAPRPCRTAPPARASSQSSTTAGQPDRRSPKPPDRPDPTTAAHDWALPHEPCPAHRQLRPSCPSLTNRSLTQGITTPPAKVGFLHKLEGGDPCNFPRVLGCRAWIPACAGMTLEQHRVLIGFW